MRIKLVDGKEIVGIFSAGTCTGFVAQSIELEPRDVREMIRLLDAVPDHLRSMLAQLSARWPSERAGET